MRLLLVEDHVPLADEHGGSRSPFVGQGNEVIETRRGQGYRYAGVAAG